VHSDVEDIATVPRLFRQIQRAIDRKAHDLVVTYGTHGVPTKVTIDTYENVVDEEQYFTVRAFKRR
jgi:molybdopterin biosynthesis enzyme MoaB